MTEKKIEDALEKERQEALLKEMGIEPHEADKLRKTMLSPDEAVHAKSEELVRAVQSRGRKEDWEEYVDAKRRMGRVLHHSEFIRRLRTIVPRLAVYRGRVNGTLSLYDFRSAPVKDCPDYKGSEKWYFTEPVYIGWCHIGEMPEYEIDVINNFQVPIGQKRGWRTILMRMIARWNHETEIVPAGSVKEVRPKVDIWGRKIRANRASIITEEQALEAFGYPTQGITASAYRRQLYEFRNAVPEVIPTKRRF